MSHNAHRVNNNEPDTVSNVSVGLPAPQVVTVTSTGTLSTPASTEAMRLIRVNNGSTAVTLTLPSAAAVPAGFSFQVKLLGSASATISAASGQTVDGGASAAITVQYDARSFYAVSSTAWEIY